VTDILRDSVWPGLILWIVLYVSDYMLTIACARLYRAQDKVAVDGSFELTPMFQADVNALRRVSPRFLIFLCLSTAFLWVAWYMTSQLPELPEAYAFILGAMVLLELAVHSRHLRNWFLFRRVLKIDRVQGRLTYPRDVMLSASAFELRVFAGLFIVLFLITANWFFVGGAVTCAATASNHAILAEKQASRAASEIGSPSKLLGTPQEQAAVLLGGAQ
jgi:hypothetical protein